VSQGCGRFFLDPTLELNKKEELGFAFLETSYKRQRTNRPETSDLQQHAKN